MTALIGDTEYGLIGCLYAGHGPGDAAAERIDIRMIAINRGVVSDPAAAFGGTRRSGLAREGGTEGIEAYLEIKYLRSVDWPTCEAKAAERHRRHRWSTRSQPALLMTLALSDG